MKETNLNIRKNTTINVDIDTSTVLLIDLPKTIDYALKQIGNVDEHTRVYINITAFSKSERDIALQEARWNIGKINSEE